MEERKKEIWFITASVLLFSLIAGLLTTVLPLYLRQQNFTIPEIGLLFSTAAIMFALGNVALGTFSDYLGRKKFIMLTIASMGLSCLLLGILPLVSLVIAAVLVVVARLLTSFSLGTFYNLTNIRLADLGKAGRGVIYGLFMFGWGGGYGIGLVLFSFLLKFMPFNYLFYIGAALAAISLILFTFTKEFVAKQKGIRFKELFHFKLSKAIKIYLLMIAFLFFAVAIVDFFLIPIYMQDVLKLLDPAIVMILGITGFIYGVVSIWGGNVVDAKNEYHVVILSFLGMMLTSFLLGRFQFTIAFIIFWMLDYFMWSFNDPARFKIGADIAGMEKGKMLSLFGLVTAISQAIGFAVAGTLVQKIGYSNMFYLRGFLVFISVIMIYWMHKVLEHEHTRPH